LVHNQRTQPWILPVGSQIIEDGALENGNQLDQEIKSEEPAEDQKNQKDFQKVTNNLGG
jgi:hypothetical protein